MNLKVRGRVYVIRPESGKPNLNLILNPKPLLGAQDDKCKTVRPNPSGNAQPALCGCFAAVELYTSFGMVTIRVPNFGSTTSRLPVIGCPTL